MNLQIDPAPDNGTAAAPTGPLPGDKPGAEITPRTLTLVVAAALFMESLVSTVIATSLAAMAADLQVDPLSLKLAFTAYFVALAMFIPISGWCADRWGAKTVFAAAIAVFTLSSVACALAWNVQSLVAGRFCQGLGGAMMLPVGRLILLRVIPKREMVSAMAWLSIPTLFAPIVGPPLGGFITTYAHWRGIFWLNVPAGLVGLALALWLVPQVLDRKGFVLTASGLALGLFGLTLLGGQGHGALALAMMAAGLALLAAYTAHARRVAHPLVDLTLLRIASFRVALAGGVMFRLAVGALPFLLPLMLQLGFGLNAFDSGLLTFSAAVGAVTMKLTAAPILRRWGFRQVLVANAWISSALMAAIAAFGAHTPGLVIMAVLLVGGFFRSLQFTSLNTLAYADVDSSALSRATALVAVVQQLALAAGVAVAALLLEASRTLDARSSLQALDFSHAFVAVSALSLGSLWWFVQLAPDAGAEMSGHKSRRRSGDD